MAHPEYDIDELVRRGEDIYERDLRALVEPEHFGEFLALDVDSGDYVIDADEMAAVLRAEADGPGRGRSRYLIRIGYKVAHVFGESLESNLR